MIHTLKIYRSLGPVDMKNIRRDSLLMWIPLLPFVMALMLRLAIPKLTIWADAEFGVDMTSIYPLLMSSFVMLVPLLAGMMTGFLLLDERDDRVLTALLVTPLPLRGYLFYRLSLPMLLGVIMTIISYPIAGLIPMSLGNLIVVSLMMSFSAPILALVLATLASNKVVGFTVMKMVNGVMMIPMLAFFIDSAWANLAGIIPAYWGLKVFWLIAEGDSNYGVYALIGIIANVIVLWWLLRQFQRVLHR